MLYPNGSSSHFSFASPYYSTFNFENDGAKIDISGVVVVKFATGRRLSVNMDRILQAVNEEETAEFNLNIILATEPELALEEADAMMNSAKATAGKAFVILGVVFAASALALW